MSPGCRVAERRGQVQRQKPPKAHDELPQSGTLTPPGQRERLEARRDLRVSLHGVKRLAGRERDHRHAQLVAEELELVQRLSLLATGACQQLIRQRPGQRAVRQAARRQPGEPVPAPASRSLGGYLPQRRRQSAALTIVPLATSQRLFDSSSQREISTTMAYVQMLGILVLDKAIHAKGLR